MYRKVALVFLAISFLLCNSTKASEPEKYTKPVKITAADYKAEIAQNVVLVEFWAAWCGPCRKLSPVLNQIAKEDKLNIKIGKINVDSNKSFALEMGVRSLPAMILYKEGKEIARFSGFYPKEDLEELIINALK